MKESLLCHPENDPNLRYLLAKKGKNNLLVIGLNPSTADSEKLDPTSKNIDIIARNHGYDGWLLVNLYPVRSSNPADLPLKEETVIYWHNIHLIQYLLDRDRFKIKDAWLAWGDGIESFNQNYLKQAAGYLYRELLVHDLNYICIGRTRRANPCHPSPQAVNCHLGGLAAIEFFPFDFKHYVRDIKLEPEVKIDGLKFN